MSEKIGDYRILESNGQDAHSTYHLASSPGGRELVWLVLSSHRIPPEGRQRATEILREAARLNHSGILEVREAAVDRQGRPFMVHGIPKGTTLETLLKKNGALDVAFALSIGIQVGHALQHAHEKGIVLGTLEKAHVLVDESGAVRVRGFGIHSAIESAEEMVNLSGGKRTRILSRGPGCFGGWSASRIGTLPWAGSFVIGWSDGAPLQHRSEMPLSFSRGS